MTSLRDRLSSHAFDQTLGRRLPERSRMERTADDVRRRLADCTPVRPSPYDLRETYEELRAVAMRRKRISELAGTHVRRAPWVLFEAQERDEDPLSENRRLVKAYLSRVESEGKRSTALNLASCFLLFYPERSRNFARLRDSIRGFIRSARGQRAERLASADRSFQLFGEGGPETVAAAVLHGTESTERMLEEAGLAGELSRSSFAAAAFRAAVRDVRNQLQQNDPQSQRLERLLEWSVLQDPAGGELQYPHLRIELAEALLEPFQEGGGSTEIAARIKSYFLEVYGDPRLSRSRWQGVSQGAEAVMLRWLVQSTLEDFFRFVAHVAGRDAEADRHWHYRHAFWRAYLRAGVIEQAWVAFGARAAEEAERRFQDRGVSYGRIRSGQNVKPNHAVLLLKVGDLTITEWSHVGKYRMWTADNENTPSFYRHEYRREQLVTGPDMEGSHHGSESGNWQRKLSQSIRQRTGITISLRELMPDGRSNS